MIRKLTLAAGLAAGLTGCVTSSGPTYHVIDPYLFFSRASLGGHVPVVIVGHPFPGRQPALEAEVLSALDRNFKSFGNPYRVVPDPNLKSSRVVVLFNMGRPLASGICETDFSKMAVPASPPAAAPADAKLLVNATYCGDGPYSSAWLEMPTPASPNVPEFRSALDTLVREALPRDIDPSHRKGNDPVVP